MNKELLAIFDYLEREKGIKRDIVISAIEEALLVAARKGKEGLFNIAVQVNPKTGNIEVTAEKEVVEKVTIPEEEVTLEEAREINPHAELGEWVLMPCLDHDFGRIAAQSARQIISQKLRVAERDVICEEYRHRVNEIISGSVKRVIRGATLIIDLGKVEGIMPDSFYPRTEKYNVGDRVQALLYQVRDTENGGAEVVLSRNDPEFVRQLFLQEIPELQENRIAIEKIVRAPGYRTKLVVKSIEPHIDPVGSCVGVRGTRVKNIIRELNEKIDIIPYAEDSVQLLVNALAPVEIRKISVNEDSSVITIVVDDDNYAAALGKRGMNARLNGELINCDLQIQKMSDYQQMVILQQQQLAMANDPTLDEKLCIEGMSSLIIESLVSAGFDTFRKVLNATPHEIAKISDISVEMAIKVLEEIHKKKG